MTSQLKELQVHSANLQGCQPFPTYNSTIAAPTKGTRGLCTILSADGELVVLQASVTHSKQDSRTPYFRVVSVLPPIEKSFSSFCQCWLQDGSVIATAHDRSVAFYSSDAFAVQRRLQVRYAVICMDMIVKKQEKQKRDSIELELLVLAATAFGAFLYVVELGEEKDAENGSSDEKLELLAPMAAVHSGVAMCTVKFSGDGYTAAMGSVDGRLFVRTLGSS
uniref:Anaphase-promoting complex subunit 4 WD40 domain-containing protein n=1 Tax=Hyaloperonospora arabidopsidis (strain Emoy2) TaxID=559515 RepID=M4B200_HYAAE